MYASKLSFYKYTVSVPIIKVVILFLKTGNLESLFIEVLKTKTDSFREK
jgi:hypothetical protein